ncbi:MAG: HYR domain-containing protein [Minisyncoccota bacterium]
MKINQLRKQKILTLIVAITLLSASFGYGPAVSADESEAKSEQVQSAESQDASLEESQDDNETTDNASDASPPDAEESAVSDTSEDSRESLPDEEALDDEEANDEEATNEESEEVTEEATDTDEDVPQEPEDDATLDPDEEEQVEEPAEVQNQETQTEEQLEELNIEEAQNTESQNIDLNKDEEMFEVRKDMGTFGGVLSVDVKANGSDGPLVIDFGETYIYSWETTNADSCIKTSPVEDLNLWVSGVSSPITPNDTLFYPTASTSVTITIECTNGYATTSDSVVISLDEDVEEDDTPPIFILMPTIHATATTSAGVIVDYTLPTAIDNEDDNVSVVCTPVSGSLFEVGTTTVTCTATDDAGNTTTAIFYVVVTLDMDDPADVTPPVIAPHENIYVKATTSAGIIVHYDEPMATDNVDLEVDVMCSPMSGTLFPIGKTVVTCTATDDAGNTATSTFYVKVILDDDNGDDHKIFVDVEANGSDGPLMLINNETYVYAWTSKNADTCKLTSPGWFYVDLNGTSSVIAVGHDFYPTATSSVTITIKCWNEHKEASDSVVVSLATTTPPVDMPPVFDPVEDIHATTSTSTGINVSYPLPTATDDITASTSLVVVCTPASGSLFPVGTTTVTCSTEDEAENTATTSFRVIVTLVVDDDDDGTGTTTPPIVEIGGLSCAATTTVTVTGTAATGTTVTLIGGTGTFMATTSANGTWSATVNLSGATSSNPFSITIFDAGGDVVATTSIDVVFDNVSPVITLNGESTMTIIVGNEFNDPGASVTDNLDASTTVSATGTVDTATVGTYTITYTAEDCAGNTATTSRTVIVAEDGGSGGGGSRRRSSNDDDDDDDNGSVIAGNVSGFDGIGGIGGGTGFLPVPIFSPFGSFIPTAMAFIPGIPNTGVGGDAGRNLAMLMTALGIASLGFTLMRKSKTIV